MDRLLEAAVIVAVLAGVTAATPRSVTYDARAFVIDGERALLLSGSIHYQRVLPADWQRSFALAAEAGFDTIQTYVFWNEHEPRRGVISYSGRNDLTSFVATAASLGLKVVVRIGPYICGEHNNGGVPLWMRGPSSGATCFRCADPEWEAFTVHVLHSVVGELTAAGALWPQGGPVIALQVENEYNGGSLGYLSYCLDAARNETTAVPWLLCHDLDLCTQVNAGKGSLGSALCTINGFWEDASEEGVQQPSPAFVAGQRKGNPNQPISWTEDQGWFDQWGEGQRIRRTSDILYGHARAVAYGLAHHNYYMLAGGSNFGYEAAEGVTTAYAPDTAIDYLLLRHEPKFSTVRAFNAALRGVAAELLENLPPPVPTPVGVYCESAAYGDVILVSNTGLNDSSTEVVVVAGRPITMPNHTVVLLRASSGIVIFNTSAAADALLPARLAAAPAPTPETAAAPTAWTTIVEHLGYGAKSASPAAGTPPLEMLNLTENTVDYAYYVLDVANPVNARTLEVTTCGGEYVYAFADGTELERHVARTARTQHSFSLFRSSVQNISILVAAMGLSTSPSPQSCKGLVKVVAGNTSLTNAGWETRWVFAGEAAQVYTPAGAAAARWAPVASDGGNVPTSWFRTSFDLPQPLPGAAIAVAEGAPPQLAYALDLAGATKGVAWVNGFNIGRYNLELGVCSGPCAPPLHGGACYIWWRNCGLPTQRYYHVPTSLLQPSDNLVVLFEEAAAVPSSGEGPVAPSPPPGAPQLRGTARDLSRVALVALTAHP